MANKTNEGKKIMRSNSKAAKNVIRQEIRSSGFNPKNYGYGKSTLDNMKKEADSYNCGDSKARRHSDYQKGAGLVDGARFAIGAGQDKMLAKIYGEKKVREWSGTKKHDIYKNLIGREYAAMLNERERDRIKKARAAAKKAAKTPAKKTTKRK